MQIPSVMPTVSSTLMLQAPFTAITALIIFRAWSVYGGRSLKHLAIGWSLWTSRMIVASFLSALAQAGVPTYAPGRRALSALGVALAVAVLPFLVSGTLSVANVIRESDRAARWSLTLAGIVIPLSLVFSAEGAPAGPRVALLLFCVTVSFGLAFGYVAWRLLRHPADSLTLGRQLAAVGFAAYAVKQLFNLNAYLSGGASGHAVTVCLREHGPHHGGDWYRGAAVRARS